MKRTGLGRGGVRLVAAFAFAASVSAAVFGAPGCADQSLGVGPFERNPGQPYLPIGLTRVPPIDPGADGGEGDLLLVASTNLDQQFNAGTLNAYSLQELDALIRCETIRQNPGRECTSAAGLDDPTCAPAMIRKLTFSPGEVARALALVEESGAATVLEAAAAGADVCAAEFEGTPFPVWKAGVLTLAGGGPIATVEIDSSDFPGTYVVLPTRFDQNVAFIRVNTDGDRAPNGRATTDYDDGLFEAPDRPDDVRYRPVLQSGSGAGGPYLSCRESAGTETVGVTSCTPRFSFPLVWDDPYSVQVETTASGERRVLIGHLTPASGGVSGVVSVLSASDLARRFDYGGGDVQVPDEDRCARDQTLAMLHEPPYPPIAGIERVDSVALVTPTPVLTTRADVGAERAVVPGLFVATNRRLEQTLPVAGVSRSRVDASVCSFLEEAIDFSVSTSTSNGVTRFDLDLDLDRRFRDVNTARPEVTVDLTPSTFGFTHRGLAYAPPSETGGEGRLWVVVRVQEQIDSDASALVTIAHDPTPEQGESELRVASVLPLGEEIATLAVSPFAPSGRRWLYALDLRSDQIFTLDVTDERPVILHRIRGRYEQPGALDGSDDRARLRYTLSSPLEVVFDRRDGRRRMYVTNFENSTVAVIDVTSDDPTRHRLVARLGVDRDTAAQQEGRRGFFREDR